MDEREEQRAQRRRRVGRVRGNDGGPHAKAVEKLPVVDAAVRLFALCVHGVAQVDRHLANVDKGVLVGGRRVEAVQLDDAVEHEVDDGHRLGGRKLAVAHKAGVRALEAGIGKGVGAEDGELADPEEGDDADGLVGAAPKVEEDLDELAGEAREARDVGGGALGLLDDVVKKLGVGELFEKVDEVGEEGVDEGADAVPALRGARERLTEGEKWVRRVKKGGKKGRKCSKTMQKGRKNHQKRT